MTIKPDVLADPNAPILIAADLTVHQARIVRQAVVQIAHPVLTRGAQAGLIEAVALTVSPIKAAIADPIDLVDPIDLAVQTDPAAVIKVDPAHNDPARTKVAADDRPAAQSNLKLIERSLV